MIEMPEPDEKVQFKNIQNTIKVPYVILCVYIAR